MELGGTRSPASFSWETLMTRAMNLPVLLILVAAVTCGAWPRSAAAQSVPLFPGDSAVDATVLTPGVDSTRIFFLADGEERPGALQVEALEVLDSGSSRILRQVLSVVSAGGTLVDTTEYRLPGLEPLRHRSRGAALGRRDLFLDYAPDRRITGRIVHPDSGTISVAAEPEHAVFDPGASVLLARALPLEAGVARTLPFFNHEALDVRWMEIEVLGPEAPAAREAPADVTVVRQGLHDGRDIFLWIRRSDRRVVEVRAPLPGGREMRGRPVERGPGR